MSQPVRSSMPKKPREAPNSLSVLRDPTPKEAEVLSAAAASYRRRTPRLKVETRTADKVTTIGPPHSDRDGFYLALKDAFGTTSSDFMMEAVTGLSTVLPRRPEGHGGTNAAVAMMQAIGPQNELEAAVGLQIIATHNLAMDSMARAFTATHQEARDRFVSQSTKLSRTMSAQLDSLIKLRGGGRQIVEVKHIYVNGPAVIGDRNQTLVTASTPPPDAEPLGTGQSRGGGDEPTNQH